MIYGSIGRLLARCPGTHEKLSASALSQGLDAGLAQHCDDAGCEPEADAVADQGERNGRAAELLDGGSCARAAAVPLRAGPVKKSLARSSQWRNLAKAAMSRRIAPIRPRDE